MQIRTPIHRNFIVNRNTCYITQLFGENKNALFYGSLGHSGIDYQTKGAWRCLFDNLKGVLNIKRTKEEEEGEVQIVAAHSGYLIVGENDNYKEGIYMKIRDKENPEYETLYFHLSKLLRWMGDKIDWSKNEPEYVEKGTIIGLGGNSGRYTTGAHLHFELRKNGIPIDPMPFLQDKIIYYDIPSKQYYYKGNPINKFKVDELRKTL